MTSSDARTEGRLYVLDLGGRVFTMKTDGTDSKTLVTGCRLPDGIAVDSDAGHIYWTNMGDPRRNDGSIERADLDGGHRTMIVPEGATYTPKQLQLDKKSGKLYWCDREGMRVMRANLDGSAIETLVQSGDGDADRRDATRWCVGVAVDIERGHIYWTQKGPDNAGRGRIFRAGIDVPRGQTPADRRDITLLFEALPEPVDLELDREHHMLYWTDRGNPPRGNTVSRTSIRGEVDQQIVLTDLMEGIGIAIDVPRDRMFITDLAGSIYRARLDGSERRVLAFVQGNLSGIAYVSTL